MDEAIQEAAKAYMRDTDEGIRETIEDMEAEVKEEESEGEMEEWRGMVSDSGNTRGRMSQYKQILHLYWLMKGLLCKAVEQVSMGMALITRDMSDYKKDLQTIQFQLCKQDMGLDRIERYIPGAANKRPVDGGSAADPAMVEPYQEDQDE